MLLNEIIGNSLSLIEPLETEKSLTLSEDKTQLIAQHSPAFFVSSNLNASQRLPVFEQICTLNRGGRSSPLTDELLQKIQDSVISTDPSLRKLSEEDLEELIPYTTDEIQEIFTSISDDLPGIHFGRVGNKQYTVMNSHEGSPYLLLPEPLGVGGSKVVHHAIALNSGDKRAISISRNETTPDWQWMQRCDSPYVLKGFEDTPSPDGHSSYLLMEYCDGGPLSASQGKASSALATQWTYDALMGLHALEDSGIRHGDLRAANLFIDHNRVKIADFDLASERSPQCGDREALMDLFREPHGLLSRLKQSDLTKMTPILEKMNNSQNSLADIGQEIVAAFPFVQN